jgi:cytochrome c
MILNANTLLGGSFAVALALVAAGPALAQMDQEAIEDGHALARQWCSGCHVVEEGAGGSDAAPAFPAIMRDASVTEEGLRGWLAAPHPPMPDLDLTRQEIDVLIAYLNSLRPE